MSYATTRPVSFRLPVEHVEFLDYMAEAYGSNRTEVLVKMLALYHRNYQQLVSRPPATEHHSETPETTVSTAETVG